MRNKKTAPAAVMPDAIAAIVMERDDLQRRLNEVKSRAAEVVTKVDAGLESAPAITTRID